MIKFNLLNAELNPICHLLALLGAHHIFHVSGLRVNDMIQKLKLPNCLQLVLHKESDVWLTVHRNSVWIRKTN